MSTEIINISMDDDFDIDELVKELKETDKEMKSSMNPSISADQVNQYILDKTTNIIENGLVALDAVQRRILTSTDSSDVESYSVLLNSITSAVETINKINLQQMKHKSAKSIKKMDIKSKEKIAQKKITAGAERRQIEGGAGHHNTTNVLIASREEFFKMVKEMDEPKEDSSKTIEAEVED